MTSSAARPSNAGTLRPAAAVNVPDGRFKIEKLQPGMPCPDFQATDEAGAKFKLSDYKGKVVLVDFWGYW